MNTNKHNTSPVRYPHWKPANLWRRIGISPLEKAYLLETQSLTEKFKKTCPNLTVEILSETTEVPLPYERQQLKLKNNEQAWVRCVLLKCGQEQKLYARTVIPNLNSSNPWYALKKLGTQPLGEILFNLNNVKRSPFKISKQRYAWPYLSHTIMATARYSLFSQQKQPLLLTEIFL